MELFDRQKKTFRDFLHEHQRGIYATLVFHLIILIVLMASGIYSYSTSDIAFMLDSSREEAKMAQQQKAQTRERLSRELDAAIASATQQLRNVAVDRSEAAGKPLKDDRHTDVEKLYDEARQLQNRLDASREELHKQQGADEVKNAPVNTPPPPAETYKGPSVLDYDLGGRKAMSLPVPAYQCQHGGDVTVQVEVNPRGYVVAVAIHTATSSNDSCLREAAKRAAFRSRFAVDTKAPARQKGTITYRFVAQ
jgi:hypothetical protein